MRRHVGLLMVAMVSGMIWVFAAFAAEPVTLTFSMQNADSAISSVQCIVPWSKKVEEATQGQVRIKHFWSQTLIKGKDAWEGVKNGVADMAMMHHTYWTNMTPLADVISLPGIPFRTAEKGSEVFWKLFEKYESIQKEFSEHQVLLLFTSDPYILITTKKPVRTLEDLKGLKLRQTGGPPTDMTLALGGVPVPIAMPDTYLSLQKGVVDGMGAPWEAIYGFRFYEVVEHYTVTPFPAVYFSICVNKKKWASLSPEIQKAIMSVGGLEGAKFWGRNFFDTTRDAVIAKAGEIGKKITPYDLPEAERARWLEIGGKPLWNQWVQKMESEGRKDARPILEDALQMLAN